MVKFVSYTISKSVEMNMFKWRVVYTHIICIDIDLRQNCHIFWRLSERFINLNAWFVMKKWKKGQPQLSDAWELDCQYRVNVRVSNSFSIKFVLWNQLLQSVHHCVCKKCVLWSMAFSIETTEMVDWRLCLWYRPLLLNTW